MLAFCVSWGFAPSPAEAGCQTRACAARVAKKQLIRTQGVPWCYRTWRCVRRAHRRHPELRWQLTTRPHAGWLAKVRACESGGNYRTNTGNGFYGAYQFTLGSWAAVGGRGMPHLASPREQDYRAVLLLGVQGRGAWPVCG